jgi:hypothetical protein
MPEGAVPVAPLVEGVLNAAHDVAAAGLEMDARVDRELHEALLRLVNAVYEHEEALELQRELELEGVRQASVFDVTAERPPATSYAGHVERIISAADGVTRSAASPSAHAVPRHALAPVCTLMEAVTAYHAQAATARQWQQAGNRFSLFRGDGPDDSPPPPASTPTPARAHPHTAAAPGAPHPEPPGGGNVASAGVDWTRPTADRLAADDSGGRIGARPSLRARLR